VSDVHSPYDQGRQERVPVGLKRTAVLCVLRSGDELLLIKRAKEPNLGLYVPVGGHVDPFEAPRQTAIREIAEETGVQVDEVRFHGVLVESSPTAYNWISFIYSVEIPRIAPPPCREGVLEWFPIARLPELPTPTTDLHLYRFVLQKRPFVMDAIFDADTRLLRMVDEISGEVLFPAGG